MVRKLKRYNRLKGLVGAILEYMEAPSPDKYEAIKGLGYKDVIIKMYTKAISVYLNYNDKYKGVTESLFDLVDELRKPNVTYNTASVKPPRTVDRQELKRVASTELERVIPIMYKHKNEGSKRVLELCKPSTYKDRTLTVYLQGVRYYCKYRRPYFKHNSAIPSIIDKIEAEEGVSEPVYKKQIKNEKPKVSALVKYLLEHVDEDYRSCLSYAVNELGYSFLTARNYIYLFRKYLQYGTKMKCKNNNYIAFYHYIEQYAKDYKLPIKEETLDDKRYDYLYKLTQMYLNNEPLDKLSATELQNIDSIRLYCDKGLKTLRLTKEDYRDLNKILKELKKETMSTSRQDTKHDMCLIYFKSFIECVTEGNNYADSIKKISSKYIVTEITVRRYLSMIIPYMLYGRVTKGMSAESIDYLNKHNTYKVRQVLEESYCSTPVDTNRDKYITLLMRIARKREGEKQVIRDFKVSSGLYRRDLKAVRDYVQKGTKDKRLCTRDHEVIRQVFNNIVPIVIPLIRRGLRVSPVNKIRQAIKMPCKVSKGYVKATEYYIKNNKWSSSNDLPPIEWKQCVEAYFAKYMSESILKEKIVESIRLLLDKPIEEICSYINIVYGVDKDTINLLYEEYKKIRDLLSEDKVEEVNISSPLDKEWIGLMQKEILKDITSNEIEEVANRVSTEVSNKEGNLDMIKKRPRSYGKPLTYEKYKEIAEMMKEIILKDEVPLDRAYFMEKYNLTYSQVRKLYSSLRSYIKKHSIVSYRVAKAWIRAIKEVVEFSSPQEKLKNVQTKNEIAEQEPTYNVEQELTHNVEEDTTDIKAGVIWNGSCSLLDNREQAIGFQKALKAFNVTDSRICRITIEDSYDYEAIDEE